jgi:hypothetical protein
MQERQTDGPARPLRLSFKDRRSTLGALKWLLLAALLFLLIAIATELIPNGVTPTVSESTGGSGSKSSSAEAAPKPSGWGPESTYLGRYRVLDASQRAGSGVTTRLSGGELTMFMREVHKGVPLVPSGILSLTAPSPVGTELLYLTSLTSYGGTREATINGGAFVGPVVGSFAGVPIGADRLSMTATVEGIGSIRATLVRFSSSPQP